MNREIVLAFSLVALLSACGRPTTPRPAAVDLARGQERWSDLTAEELQLGRSLFVGRCGSCHQLPSPQQLAPEEWPAVVGRKQAPAGLNKNQARAVKRYLITISARPRK